MKPTTRQVFDALSASAVVRDLRTERGTCKGCGECCSRFLPLLPLDMLLLEAEIRLSNGGIVHERGPYDMRCPFLDEEGMCEIYENRPAICAAYRCDHHAKGDLSAFASIEGAMVVDVALFSESVLLKMASAADGAVKNKAGNSEVSDRTVANRAQPKRVEASAVDAVEGGE